ncbi:shikimate dehydrogenase [Lysobacter ciconiae]|uniref:Shikimate dehydrogenase (NADP(+)) n=1 Tax=Novilysobacter ciconiae TaxID=2781022 RepID=A0A7S6ZSB3_9GAMM|nr:MULTISPECIES: shikimate dehydrogenase [Lysobacter]QOW19625.1 shikimate dehydrogenase [Lysobacter ciconiae]QOY62849.1 shikimate dehydrogenase [Lysobacter sp. H21R4]
MPTPRFALIGHPVAHSLSPRIHAAFARQTGIAMDYGLIDATAEEFDDALAKFAAAGGKGANVTLPHKARAAAACESLSDRARRCGVVNTLTRTATGWAGDNTDGLGLVRDLTDRHGQDLRGRRVLLIGAGGVAHGVAPALLDAGISGLMIVNRTDSRTDALADLLGDPARVHPRNFADLHTQGVFDLIINATSIGHAADGGELPLPQSLIAPRGDVVDLGYGEASIGFLAWARAGGADQMMDGLGMLVEQAAESFNVWHGVRPSTDEIYAELRAESGLTTVA